jgi:3-oxoacyl-[acyl-carrier protein] reductase
LRLEENGLSIGADNWRFDGKVAAVTGSSSGIGFQIAASFADRGANVITNSRSLERADQAAKRIVSTGGTAEPVAADIRTRAGADKLVQAAVSAFGGLDILVNNAGISMIADSEDLSADDWVRAIETNLSGPFFCSQAAHASMKQRGGGIIVQIGSIAGHVALPRRAAYCAAKHGLLGLTKVLALDWARDNIRVLSVDPAYIRTPLDTADQIAGGYDDTAIERRTPIGRFGTVQDVAQLVLAMCSSAGSYITGSSVLVDGGWVAYGYV